MAELSAIQIVIPGAGAQAQWFQQWQIQRQAQAEAESGWHIENIHFEHDPLWSSRLMSIQCAHDLNHPVWKATGVLMETAMWGPYLCSPWIAPWTL